MDHFDEATPGLSLRITPRGTRTWCLFYRANGVQRRMTLGRYPAVGLADARDLACEALRELAKGGDPARDRRATREPVSFGELCDQYIERYAKPRKKSWSEDQRQIDANLAHWRNRAAASVSRQDVREVLDAMVSRGAPVAANRTRALISKIFNFGIERELVEQNPVMGVGKAVAERARERFLTPEEIRRIWVACETQMPRVSAWFRLRLATAQRGGEILQMRWKDVDDDWWTLPAEYVKTGHGHRVYLNHVAQEALEAVTRKSRCEWVFPRSLMGDFKHVSRRLAIANRGNVIDFRGHDLRRTAASFMTSGGVPRFIVARVLNHSDDRDITGVYDGYSYDHEKRAAMVFWAKQLRAVLEDRAVAEVGRFSL